MSLECSQCHGAVPFVAIPAEDLYERSRRGPCCLVSAPDQFTPDLFRDLRCVGGDPHAEVRVPTADAIALGVAFWAKKAGAPAQPPIAPDPVPAPDPEPVPEPAPAEAPAS